MSETKPSIKQLPLKDIVRDEDLQMRVHTCGDHIESIKEAILDKAKLPPVIVYTDGISFFLADGHHRYIAHAGLGKEKILCEIREGGRTAALEYAFGANRENNALTRTTADKQKALAAAYLHNPKLSERKLADLVGVSKSMVHRYKESMEKRSNGPLSEDPKPNEKRSNGPLPAQQETFFNVFERHFKPVRKSFDELLNNSGFIDPKLPTEDKLKVLEDVKANLKAMQSDTDHKIKKLTQGAEA